MKIAYFLNHFPVLSQTFVLNQITGLVDRGHQVDIYAKSPGTQRVVHADVERYNLLERTCYRNLVYPMPHNKFLRLLGAINWSLKLFPRQRLPLLRSMNVARFRREAFSLGLFYKVLPFLDHNAQEYDIIHCHFAVNGMLAALLKEIGAIKGKIVTTFHGEAGHTNEKRLTGYESLFKLGDLFLPMSKTERQNLIQLGCNPQKIVVHRMGVDIERFKFALRQPRQNSSVNLLTVARLVEKKGVAYGIQAVGQVLRQYPHIHYKIVGDGPLRKDLSDLVDRLCISQQVEILGWKRQNEVVELIKEADLLLAPSVESQDGDREGLPVVLMEALAQGLPVLSTYHSAIPELVQDGRSGFLVPERDVEALTKKLLYFIQHPQIWPGMSQSGREHIEQHYDIHRLNDRLVFLFENLLAGTST